MFDRCGVCDGDGTSCIGKRLTYKGLPNPMKGRLTSCKRYIYALESAKYTLEMFGDLKVVKRATETRVK